MPNLEILSIAPMRFSRKEFKYPITTFKHNRKLVGFICEGAPLKGIVNASIFREAPNLEHLDFNELVSYDSLADFECFLSLSSLQYLAIRHYAFHQSIFDKWFSSGKLAKLLYFEGQYIPDMTKTPKLETLFIRISGRSKAGSVPDYSLTQTAPDSLSSIKLWLPSSSDLKSFQFPKPENIQEFVSRSGNFTNIEKVEQFKILKILRLLRHKGEFESIDLGAFPKLEMFVVSRVKKLSEIKSLTTHPQLKTISIGECKDLEKIGMPSPNSTLITARFHRCPKLRNLDALNGTTALKALTILYCDLIPDISKIRAGNKLNSIWIQWNEILKDEN